MKGAKLYIEVFTYAAMALAFIMTILDIHNSWSDHAMTPQVPLLNAAIGMICFIFLIRSLTYADREQVLFHIFRMPFRVSHSNSLTWLMFFGIIVFHVTHPHLWVEILHLIFTGAAIVSAYTEMLFVYERKPEKWGNVLGVVAGCIGFALGFFFHLYSISTAEVLAALPIAVYVLSTNK
jgi:hypothetical protein